MHVMPRLLFVKGVLLLAVTPWAGAQSPLPDPVAPAVIGRPLDQIAPARPKRQNQEAAKPKRPGPVAAANKGISLKPSGAPAIAAPAVQAGPPSQHAAKQAVDDRVDPRAQVPNNVGTGTHLARKPLAPGAYIGSRHQALVRKYYEAQPVSGRAPSWKIGEPVPPRAALKGVPDQVRAVLPPVPPGHQYVQVDGEVVLVAVQSRMVVDGVSRTLR